MCDEEWIPYDNGKRNKQWLLPNKKAKLTRKHSLTIPKISFCILRDYIEIIYYKTLNPGKIVNIKLYCEQLNRLNQNQIRKR